MQARLGLLDLFYLDQSGFAPTLPTGYSWARVGQRKRVRYEAPAGRRVNVVGALAPFGPSGPRLVFESRRTDQGKYDGVVHLRFVQERVAGLPPEAPPEFRRARPCVIVLDNYAVHHSQVVKAATAELNAQGVRFFFLPPYSPELNLIEPCWRQVKYQDLPERSHTNAVDLQAAVDTALTARAQRYRTSHVELPRSA